MTDHIGLNNLKINHFTELDAELYCQISNINPDDITYLDLQMKKTVKILKSLTNIVILYCLKAFKTVNIRNELKGIKIYD